MTRFGEISPLWQTFKSLWPMFRGSTLHLPQISNLFWHIFSYAIGEILIVANGHILKY